MEGNVKRYWTTDEVDEKVEQYRKEIAHLSEAKDMLRRINNNARFKKTFKKTHMVVTNYLKNK